MEAVLVPESLAEFEDKLRSCVKPLSIPAIAWGVLRAGEPSVYACGFANKESQLEATPDTPFAMASVTKPMTTTALAILVSRGLIDLDAPINGYLGESKVQSRAGEADEVTVRRVADHSAGLPLHYQFYYEDEPYRRPPFEETIRRYAKTFTPVGARHHYSNLGYGLLDHLIERVSGRPYDEFMADEVFEKLGMKTASIGAPKGRDYAVSYGPDGVAYPLYDFDHPGGSAAYASVEDLLAFAQYHLNETPDVAAMHAITVSTGERRGYGLGWGINEDHFGLRIVEHTGYMGGVSTILRLVPEHSLAIAIVANGQSDLIWKSANDAMAALLPEYRKKLVEERARAKEPSPPLLVTPEFFGSWTGTVETYSGDRPLTIDVIDTAEAFATLDGKRAPIDELQVQSGRLVGLFDGDVQTEDAARRPYRIHLDLGLQSGKLQGAANTISKTENGGGGAPGKRFGNALAYFVTLKR